jgi:hypothetical protein
MKAHPSMTASPSAEHLSAAVEPTGLALTLRRVAIGVAGLAVAGLAGAACVLSFDDLRTLAVMANARTDFAYLYPAAFDALLVTSLISFLLLRTASPLVRLQAGLVLLVLLGGAAWANVAMATHATFDVRRGAITIAILPWAMLAVGLWLLLLLAKHAQARRAVYEGDTDGAPRDIVPFNGSEGEERFQPSHRREPVSPVSEPEPQPEPEPEPAVARQTAGAGPEPVVVPVPQTASPVSEPVSPVSKPVTEPVSPVAEPVSPAFKPVAEPVSPVSKPVAAPEAAPPLEEAEPVAEPPLPTPVVPPTPAPETPPVTAPPPDLEVTSPEEASAPRRERRRERPSRPVQWGDLIRPHSGDVLVHPLHKEEAEAEESPTTAERATEEDLAEATDTPQQETESETETATDTAATNEQPETENEQDDTEKDPSDGSDGENEKDTQPFPHLRLNPESPENPESAGSPESPANPDPAHGYTEADPGEHPGHEPYVGTGATTQPTTPSAPPSGRMRSTPRPPED